MSRTHSLLLFAACAVFLGLPSTWAAEERNLSYRELEGVVEEFRFIRQWRHYYWREDFTMLVRDDAGKLHRVISREPTPWNDLRLGTTYTGLKVNWDRKPRVRIIGVQGVDRQPAGFYDLALKPPETLTAFIVRVHAGDAKPWQDYYINNWFHPWGPQADREVLANYASDDKHYTIFGFLQAAPAPFDSNGKAALEASAAEWGGVIYHARVVKTATGHELRLLHLLGRNKKSLKYAVFHGSADELTRLDGNKPRFVDVTESSGITIAENTGVGGTNPHSVAVEDFDGDGRYDMIIPTFGAPHVRYFRNLGKLRFQDITAGSGLESFQGAGTGAAVADYNHDGKLDVYLTSVRGSASRLFQGRGDGTFADVSQQAGVLVEAPARSCAWSDIDGDGWVDLYVTCPKGPNRLFRNLQNGMFADIAGQAGVDLPDSESLGCAFGDLNGDGWDDLVVANYHSQTSACFTNLKNGTFRNITERAGLARKASSVGCVLADVLNRGHLDLFLTTDSWLSGANYTEAQLLAQGHLVEPNVLYLNSANGKFMPLDQSTLAHKTLSHDAVLEDLDLDGHLDLYVGVDAQSGNHWATSKGGNPLWTRPDGKTWQEKSADWGLNLEANCVCVPAVDFDGDGDLDLLCVNFYSNVVLYRNETNGKNWLRVKVAGGSANPDGIGAKVKLFSTSGKKEALIGYREIQSGSGYCRSSPLEAHFGIPSQGSGPYRIEVQFPGDSRKIQRSVQPGTTLVVRRDDPEGK